MKQRGTEQSSFYFLHKKSHFPCPFVCLRAVLLDIQDVPHIQNCRSWIRTPKGGPGVQSGVEHCGQETGWGARSKHTQQAPPMAKSHSCKTKEIVKLTYSFHSFVSYECSLHQPGQNSITSLQISFQCIMNPPA